MLRRRFVLAALLAAVGALAAPDTSQATFVVNVYIDGVLKDTYNGVQDPFSGTWSASSNGAKTYGTSTDYVRVNLSADSNLPGDSLGAYVLNTTARVETGGSVSQQHRIVLEAIGQPFTAPGQAGDRLFLANQVTSIGGTGLGSGINGLNGPNIDIYAQVDPDLGNDPSTNDRVRTAPDSYFAKPDGNGYCTPYVSFIRGSTYSLATVIDVTLAAKSYGQFTTEAMVVAPAPSGLILVAGVVPFVGLLRRRLWGSAPAAV